jgi:glycosyltransferase involved in cell wall biosynthesis
MRIGIEAQRLLRKNKHGIEIVAFNLLRHLTTSDTRNDYILFTRNGDDAACLSSIPNVRIVILPAVSYADWEQIQLPLAVKRERIDILHCTSSTAPLFVSVPVILTVHDVINFERPLFGEKGQSLYQRLGNFYRTIVSLRAMEQAAGIITVSEFEKEQILSRFPQFAGKVSVIPNGVNAEFFSSASEKQIRDARKRYELPRNYFLHFGNTDPKKNTEFVIRSFVLYASVTRRIIPLVVTDLTRNTVLRILEKYSAAAFAQHIMTPGYIDHEHLPAVYAPALGLLFPSKRESFGLPVLEAMAAGVPVVAMNTSAMPEIVGDAAFFIDSENDDDLAAAMKSIQDDMQTVITMVRRGYKNIERFSWQRSSQQYTIKFSAFRHLIVDPPVQSMNYQVQPQFS